MATPEEKLATLVLTLPGPLQLPAGATLQPAGRN
jgi:hypothetical protein